MEKDITLEGLRYPGYATPVVCVPSVNRILMSFERKGYIEYIGEEVGITYDCFIEDVTEETGAVKLLGSVI